MHAIFMPGNEYTACWMLVPKSRWVVRSYIRVIVRDAPVWSNRARSGGVLHLEAVVAYASPSYALHLGLSVALPVGHKSIFRQRVYLFQCLRACESVDPTDAIFVRAL